MKQLVSILIPAYNAQEWISEAIQSAIDQTWERKEIIVVDDGSTDQTLAVARRLASSEVSIVEQDHRGAAATRNHAFSLSQGDYIQWLDADDLLSADKIAKQMEVVEQYPNPRTLLSSEFGSFMYRTNRAKFFPTPLWCDLSPIEWLMRRMGQHYWMQTATWLVSRELTEAAGPWDTRMLSDDDGEYFCRVILASEGIRFVPEAKVLQRVTPSSRLSYVGASVKKQDALLLSMQLHVKYIRSLEDTEQVRAACLYYLQTYLFHFHPERPDILERLQELARELGGRLETPQLRWKYAWMKPLFGPRVAKRAQLVLPRFREYLWISWDKLMHNLEGRNRCKA